MSKDRDIERYVYSNPSVELGNELGNEVSGSVDSGVTCRVENLPEQLCVPLSVGERGNDTMRPTQPSAQDTREERVRFLLAVDADEEAAIEYHTAAPLRRVSAARTITRRPTSLASFDELFDGVSLSEYPLPPPYRRSDSFSDDSLETEGISSYKKDECVHNRMSKSSLRQILHESWQNTTNYWSFRRRLGPYLNDKYCMRFQIHATIFMFMHVVYGAGLLSMGTFFWNRQTGVDPISGAYLLANGVLSVFLFPILIMEWGPRIGGCLEEKSPVEAVYYFAIALFLRICACAAGSFCVFYRYAIYFGPEADPGFASHKWEFIFVMVSVCMDWFVFFISIIIPSWCCVCCYCCAGTKLCAPIGKKILKVEQLEIVRE